MSGEKGERFFTQLKAQLDVVLKDFRVHFHFFAEVPERESNTDNDGVPPATFAFLDQIFSNDGGEKRPERVSYIKNMDVKGTLYHQMNADMIVTTGSSFPLLAATVSPKVCWCDCGNCLDCLCIRNASFPSHVLLLFPARAPLYAIQGGRVLPYADAVRLRKRGRDG